METSNGEETGLDWRLLPFAELDLDALYEAMALRQRVFAVEQNCAYLDADGLDRGAWHLLGWANGGLLAYARLFPPNGEGRAAIGRVVTEPAIRGRGLGRVLMRRALEEVARLWGDPPVEIGAQNYLRAFYETLGFEPLGEIYMEDGIEHVKMLRKTEMSRHPERSVHD